MRLYTAFLCLSLGLIGELVWSGGTPCRSTLITWTSNESIGVRRGGTFSLVKEDESVVFNITLPTGLESLTVNMRRPSSTWESPSRELAQPCKLRPTEPRLSACESLSYPYFPRSAARDEAHQEPHHEISVQAVFNPSRLELSSHTRLQRVACEVLSNLFSPIAVPFSSIFDDCCFGDKSLHTFSSTDQNYGCFMAHSEETWPERREGAPPSITMRKLFRTKVSEIFKIQLIYINPPPLPLKTNC